MINKNNYFFTFDERACKSCNGECCRGDKGYIFISLEEMKTISSFLSLSLEEFIKRYTVKVGKRYSLIENKYNEEYLCCFFDHIEKRCRIYEKRPKQCRTFPFWSCFINNKDCKNDNDLRKCPGIIFK